ncbi:hypothetical protein KEN51_CDS0296 [Pseudomonas phage vB_Pae10145-KEN51]|uniref:PHIKZ109.1 n=7 Tax=Viruses TaxID=10239 RepID=L7T496_BPDPK|nr:hypothetical protein [Pseudomonas aeruginosa]YP_009619779.1 hypothetical protein FDJ06_gp239 [Pseudomonas phage SL2]YP_009639908.1 PHIKZ109.1 [Pseudomonas phage phiKZ]ANM44897.1 hypothetical protein KTN4_139 [Pseudomonas phage KTN4]QGK90133.1 hypothetical protein [Pseudomonas phage vB_PA32_GUMS]QJB22775.1 hypothetical protein fnug_132 [Pseudomonas phage fnug]QOV07987.1 hypothetical protein [Pseudomonas phage vB_PaeM_kmuB]QXN68583.1 hypothetical protein [Pseudomonas phage PA7]UNI71727.1 h
MSESKEVINMVECFISESYMEPGVDHNRRILMREYGINPNSGIPLRGNWVLRNMLTGEFIDNDKYLNDIVERNSIQFERNTFV